MGSHIKQKIYRAMASKRLFYGLVCFFILEAVWTAVSGVYPMAFDENFHFGIILLYAHHISPFWSSQPAGGDVFGAVYRDPSYLFQYLMSFVYRFLELFTHDQTIQVIVLRFVDIAFFAASFPFYRRLILKLGASEVVVNICTALFVLIPVTSFLAAQINYDNLLILLIGVSLVLTVSVGEGLKRLHRLELGKVLALLIVCMAASLVQYSFLPVFLAIIVYLAIGLRHEVRRHHSAWSVVRAGLHARSRTVTTLLLGGFVLMSVLFGQRYVINAVRYGNPIPDCSSVLSIQQCSQYSPWYRNYELEQSKHNVTRSPLIFTADWFYGMWLRCFFAVAGPGTDFQTKGPLVLPGVSAIVTFGAGFLLVCAYNKRLWRRYNKSVLVLIGIVTICYVGALWLDEYQSFLQTGQSVAINGRYLVPVLLPVMAIMGLAYKELFGSHQRLAVIYSSLALVCMLWGGGVFTYILRSNDAWYWPNSTVRSINHDVQAMAGPVVPGYTSPGAFL